MELTKEELNVIAANLKQLTVKIAEAPYFVNLIGKIEAIAGEIEEKIKEEVKEIETPAENTEVPAEVPTDTTEAPVAPEVPAESTN